jgi:prolyl oligopeptidase
MVTPSASIGPSASTSAGESASDASTARWPAPPETMRRPTTSSFHGVTVTDDYRWLESDDAPEVRSWIDAQNRHTRSVLDAIEGRPALAAAMARALGASSGGHRQIHAGKKGIFALADRPPKQQPFLVWMASVDAPETERVVVDPNRIDETGKTTLDWFAVSPDDALVAVSLSEGGSESGALHVFEVATGKERLIDRIPRVQGGTAGGSVAWRKDGKSFWYTRYPRKGERPDADLDFFQQVYVHTLGKPESTDRYAVGKEFPKIAEIELETSPDGQIVLAKVAHGDGGEFEYWVSEKGGTSPWHSIAKVEDRVVDAHFAADGGLYFVGHRGLDGAPTPRGCLIGGGHSVAATGAAAMTLPSVVVPESDGVIEQLVIGKRWIYVVELAGGPSRLRIYERRGARAKLVGEAALPPVTGVSEVASLDPDGETIAVRSTSYVEPARWLVVRGADRSVRSSALVEKLSIPLPKLVVRRGEARSKDGTKVPMSIVRAAGTPDAPDAPTVLYGYGGFGVSLVPRFSPKLLPFLASGGTWVVANLRGGGELGEAWHLAGALRNKQNVFDDFAAAAEKLLADHATDRAHLAIMGESNGGLLMGATLTQHPDLFAAVVARVGIYDMLHVEESANGAFNVPEYGSVKDPDLFRAMFSYSPLPAVRDGVRYPDTLLTTGQNDPRVSPWQSRKMAARLQAASGRRSLALLRTDAGAGHGMGTPLAALVEEQTDIFAFLFDRLGMKVKPID